MFWEGDGKLRVHPPYLQAPGDVGCGRESSLSLGGSREVSVCARSSERTLGKHGICDDSPESPALRVGGPIEAGCFYFCVRLRYYSIKEYTSPISLKFLVSSHQQNSIAVTCEWMRGCYEMKE